MYSRFNIPLNLLHARATLNPGRFPEGHLLNISSVSPLNVLWGGPFLQKGTGTQGGVEMDIEGQAFQGIRGLVWTLSQSICAVGGGLGCEPTGGLGLSLELSEVGVTWPLSKLHVGSLGGRSWKNQ